MRHPIYVGHFNRSRHFDEFRLEPIGTIAHNLESTSIDANRTDSAD